jgi:hypothetical protein
MSSMSYLFNGPVLRSMQRIQGAYVAQRDGRRYSYSAKWRFSGASVRWAAEVAQGDGSVASLRGSFSRKVLGGERTEDWVRAAVELAIERRAKPPRDLAR